MLEYTHKHTGTYLLFIKKKKEKLRFTNILCVDWRQYSHWAGTSDGLSANTTPRSLEGKGGSSHSKEWVTEGSVR